MTISEKAKLAAVKRRIKLEYGKAMAKATAKGLERREAFHLGQAEAYFDCFRMLFNPDGEMTDEMLKQLINLKDNE